MVMGVLFQECFVGVALNLLCRINLSRVRPRAQQQQGREDATRGL